MFSTHVIQSTFLEICQPLKKKKTFESNTMPKELLTNLSLCTIKSIHDYIELDVYFLLYLIWLSSVHLDNFTILQVLEKLLKPNNKFSHEF